jgi:hypothetical protein
LVAIGRRYQSHIHLLSPVAAEFFKLTFLQSPQKFGLDLDWNVSNLVEKQCPLIGELKPADLLRNRASEGASFMPKELTLEQPTRNRGAVEFYKSPPFPPAAFMDGARKQFLSRTGFTLPLRMV